MSDLPAAPFDACDQATGRVSSQALVRYKTNDYSVPVAYGHRDVWIRGYVDMVVIGCGGEVIARHPRCYDREDMVFDAVHYLPLIEQKICSRRSRPLRMLGRSGRKSCAPVSGRSNCPVPM